MPSKIKNKYKLQKNLIKNVKFGKNVKIISPVNLYDCEIGDDVFIGPFVEIQNNVKIGKKCRIQSHSFICENTTIGNNVFIGHGVMFVNDKMKNGIRASENNKKLEKVIIGNNINIGSNSTILPVKIIDNVTIGAASLVSKDIKIKGIYYGSPAKKN
jgi:acetyltransferase-like isoleucine patch superfamily enzyme